MIRELAARLTAATGKTYSWKKRKIKSVDSRTGLFQSLTTDSCLAHVINLATQMLISTYSKSPHFDPKEPDAHVPTTRDEVGLVRAIVVKVWIIYLARWWHSSLSFRNAHLQNEKKCGRPFKPRWIIPHRFNSFSTWRCSGHQHIWCLIGRKEKKTCVAYSKWKISLN